MTGKLFGDYELLIDECLDGCSHLKHKVAVADQRNRGGLAVLLNALHNKRPHLSPFHTRLVEQLKADQDYWIAKRSDCKNIYLRDNGNYQVKLVVEHNRYSATFETLEEAQWWRDQMLTLGVQINDL